MKVLKSILYIIFTYSTFQLCASPAGNNEFNGVVPAQDISHPSRPRAVIPFEMENDAIIVTLRLNDSHRPLRFLFDTGADGMAITKALADSLGVTVSHQQSASIVGANKEISISRGNTVHLDTLSLPGQNMAIFEDMGHDGIIGLNLAWAFIVKVDFTQSKIFLYDREGYMPEEGEIEIPITIPDGIIRVPCELNLMGKAVISDNFAFDTGAGFHVVAFSPFVRKNRLLLGGFKYDSQTSMSSMGHITSVYHGKAVDFSFGGQHFSNLPIALQASSGNTNWDPGAAGSVGIQLIKNYNFTIDIENEKLYLKKNQNYTLPQNP